MYIAFTRVPYILMNTQAQTICYNMVLEESRDMSISFPVILVGDVIYYLLLGM